MNWSEIVDLPADELAHVDVMEKPYPNHKTIVWKSPCGGTYAKLHVPDKNYSGSELTAMRALSFWVVARIENIEGFVRVLNGSDSFNADYRACLLHGSEVMLGAHTSRLNERGITKVALEEINDPEMVVNGVRWGYPSVGQYSGDPESVPVTCGTSTTPMSPSPRE